MIEYKTDATFELVKPVRSLTALTAAAKYVVGSTYVTLLQGQNRIQLSSRQLEDLVAHSPQVLKDLKDE
jgi:hypothetical protein